MASRVPQSMVAVSSPRSSFVTSDGLSAAAPPILVVKSKDDIEKILPLLAGALLSQGGRMGAAKLAKPLMARLNAARSARAASKAGFAPKGGGSNTLNALRGKGYTGMSEQPVKISGYKQGLETPGLELPKGSDTWDDFFESSQEVKDLSPTTSTPPGGSHQTNLFDDFPEGQSSIAQSAATPTGRQIAGAKRRALQSQIDTQKLKVPQPEQVTLPNAAKVPPLTGEEMGMVATGGVGVAAYGAQGMQARSQQNAELQRQEQDRIQQVAEQARSKAGTGGGQVGVAA